MPVHLPLETWPLHQDWQPQFPVYLSQDKASRESTFFKNFYRDGIEVWKQFSLDHQFDFQSQLRNKIVEHWQQKQIKNKELSND